MKKMLIILMALVAFVSITAFGSEPTDENAPIPTEEDIFLSDLSQLSEEELMYIIGTLEAIDANGETLYNQNTGHIINFNTGKKYKRIEIPVGTLISVVGGLTICGGTIIGFFNPEKGGVVIVVGMGLIYLGNFIDSIISTPIIIYVSIK